MSLFPDSCACPFCHGARTRYNGEDRHGVGIWYCRDCQKLFRRPRFVHSRRLARSCGATLVVLGLLGLLVIIVYLWQR
jgi:ribosomal protein L37AE/L43A